MRTYAQLTTSFVVFCNRVGVDESITFWGGSEVIAPERRAGVLARRSSTRGCSSSTSTSATCGGSGSRCRCCATSGPSSVARELAAARSRERAGLAADDDAEPGSHGRLRRRGRARAETASEPMTDGAGRCSSCPTSSRSTPTSRGGSSREFIRGQLRQAGFERRRARAVGRDRLGARGLPRGRGDRRRAAAVRADAVPDVVARVARRRRGGRAPPRLRVASSSTSAPMVDGVLRVDGAPARRATRASTRRRCGAATSWRGCG